MTQTAAQKKKGGRKKAPQKPKQKKSTKQKPVKKRNLKVATASRSQKVVITDKIGNVSVYTKDQLVQMRRLGKQPPENYVRLAVANNVTFSNDLAAGGVRLNWEAVAEAIIAYCVAHSPMTPIPGGPAALKYYLWLFGFSRWRKPTVQGIIPGTAATTDYSSDIIADFNEENWKVPVAYAKMIQYTMPYKDPATGACYQWQQAWNLMFDNYAVNTLPTFSGPSISTLAAVNDVWNRTVFGNSILRAKANLAGPIPAGEFSYGINPDAESPTKNTVTSLGSDISKYFNNIISSVEGSKVPSWAPDGSFYSVVNRANSRFPSIQTNCKYADEEMSYIFVEAQNASTFTTQTPQIFKYVRALPAVNNQVLPTKLPANYPAQYMMITNYVQCLGNAMWNNGGRKALLKSVHTAYPGLSSFKPIYFMLDLNGFHQMCEDAIDITCQNLAVAPQLQGGDPRTPANVAAMSTCLESALITNVLRFSWPSIFFYSSSDVASNTATSAQFKTLIVPPLIADYITGCKPCVSGGCMYVPLLDYRAPAFISAGAKFWGLNPLTDPISSRWFWRLNPDVADVPGGLPYLEQYTPSTAIATSLVPPTSSDRVTAFATGILTTAGNAAAIWGNTPINPATIFGALVVPVNQSPLTISNTAVYLPATPVRYAHDAIGAYTNLISATNNSFIVPEQQDLGLFASFNPVVATSVFVVPDNQLQLSGAALMVTQFSFNVSEVGSVFPLDCGSIGRSAVFAFKRSTNISMMPFAMTVASAVSPVFTFMSVSMRVQSYNSWTTELTARITGGVTKIQAVRAMFESLFANIGGDTSTEDLHAGDAILQIEKAVCDTAVAPYHNGTILSTVSMNSPTLYNTLNATQTFKGANGDVPFISPILDFLGDLGHILGF